MAAVVVSAFSGGASSSPGNSSPGGGGSPGTSPSGATASTLRPSKAPSHWTLPLGIAQFRNSNEVDWPALTAVAVMATIPILILYLFFQRYFVAGIAASGVKG